MFQQLTISSLIEYAARYHGATQAVSVEMDGSLGRLTWSEVKENARRQGSALDRPGIYDGARCGTIAWNNLAGMFRCGGQRTCHPHHQSTADPGTAGL